MSEPEHQFLGTCFVIQPFDKGGEFDKRYKDIIAPSIEEGKLKPYRVDTDYSVSIPIESIKIEIQKAKICLADITTDNPNIWFELGFAIAMHKEILVICKKGAREKYPFDVNYYHVIEYSNDSKSDFESLGKEIISRISERLKKVDVYSAMATESPIKETEGLSPHELTALVIIHQNSFIYSCGVRPSKIREDMVGFMYTEIAASMAVSTLLKKGFISRNKETDRYDEYDSFQVTSSGEEWLIKNQDKIKLTIAPNQSTEDTGILPF